MMVWGRYLKYGCLEPWGHAAVRIGGLPASHDLGCEAYMWLILDIAG